MFVYVSDYGRRVRRGSNFGTSKKIFLDDLKLTDLCNSTTKAVLLLEVTLFTE